jgi:hypothetical protein
VTQQPDPPAPANAAASAQTPAAHHIYWSVPAPYGYAAAIDGFGSVAAPLLAGFAIAVVGITVPLTFASPVRYPGTAIGFTALAALMLLASVQCSMWAREYAVTPSDMLEWWPDSAGPPTDRAARLEDLRVTQWRYATIAGTWLSRARLTYHMGIVSLLVGLLVILVPKVWTPSRVAAVCLVGIGIAVELGWSFAPSHRSWPLIKRLFPEPADIRTTLPPYQGPLP